MWTPITRVDFAWMFDRSPPPTPPPPAPPPQELQVEIPKQSAVVSPASVAAPPGSNHTRPPPVNTPKQSVFSAQPVNTPEQSTPDASKAPASTADASPLSNISNTPTPPTKMPGTVLYVGKLSPITTYADIHAFFTGFEITTVCIVKHRHALVTLPTAADAALAIANLNGKELKQMKVTVALKNSAPPPPASKKGFQTPTKPAPPPTGAETKDCIKRRSKSLFALAPSNITAAAATASQSAPAAEDNPLPAPPAINPAPPRSKRKRMRARDRYRADKAALETVQDTPTTSIAALPPAAEPKEKKRNYNKDVHKGDPGTPVPETPATSEKKPNVQKNPASEDALAAVTEAAIPPPATPAEKKSKKRKRNKAAPAAAAATTPTSLDTAESIAKKQKIDNPTPAPQAPEGLQNKISGTSVIVAVRSKRNRKKKAKAPTV